ncbi:hypothetical protein [Marivita cryptomonadis]|uniref:BppU N-terminal domain-containing protein n=2 Tax=Roseobacteraceae TaxID=2854170 RepID=A0A9Q2S0C7_9RHOB|nr:hypothetical protein [Marivita cryptomonadis]MCR9169500.1 hypothetical protein [Paracoccaceae bacterium]MBM2331818.1 hypothetical protein [Marivita cryptomonadis]MBM2346066.1 hypothetical protein [Marivita cryptomonadis]MBM2350743.1 hypothetical protein [Marivita cryptomonadis]MBM2369927.1 hypothetical protein [Marivita cryptomonadis]
MKQNDTGPALAVTLIDIDPFGGEAVVDLKSGSTVVFNMRLRGSQVKKVDRAASVITNSALGEVEYRWSASDTDTPGRYEGEFEVTFADGAVLTYPREGYIPIPIGDDIG